MTAILVVLVLLLIIKLVRYNAIYKKQIIVGDLADSRRKLIELVHKDIFTVDSHSFRFLYKSIETLIRIRYFKLNHLLPNSAEFFEKKLSDESKEEIGLIKQELAKLRAGPYAKEFNEFLRQASRAIFKGFIKNKTILLFFAMSKILFLLAQLGLLKIKLFGRKKINSMNSYSSSKNNLKEIFELQKTH